MALTKSYNIKNNVKHLTNLFNYDFNENKIPNHFVYFENCEQATFIDNMLLLQSAKNHSAGKDIKNQFFSGEILFKIPMATATEEDKERALKIAVKSLKRHLGPDIAFCCVLHEKSDDDSEDGYLHVHYLGSRVNVAEPKKAILPCTQDFDWDDISKIAKEEEFKVFGDKYASHPLTYKQFNKFKKEHGLETGKVVGEQQYFVSHGILRTDPGSGSVLYNKTKLENYKNSDKKRYYSKKTSLGSSVTQSKSRPWEYTISDKPNATKNALNHIYTDIDNAIAEVRHQHELDPTKGLGLGYVLKELRSIGYKVGNERKDSKNPLTLQYRNHAWKIKAPGYTREDIDARCKGLMEFEPNHPTVATFINTEHELFKETGSKTKKYAQRRNYTFGQLMLRTVILSTANTNALGLLLAILLLIVLIGFKKIKEETAMVEPNTKFYKAIKNPNTLEKIIENLDKGVALEKIKLEEKETITISKNDDVFADILEKRLEKDEKKSSERQLEPETKTITHINSIESVGGPGSGTPNTPQNIDEKPGSGISAMEEDPGSGASDQYLSSKYEELLEHLYIINDETYIEKEDIIKSKIPDIKVKYPNLSDKELKKKATILAKKDIAWKRSNETINFSIDYIKNHYQNFYKAIAETDNKEFTTPTKFTTSPIGIIKFFNQEFYKLDNENEGLSDVEFKEYLIKNYPSIYNDFKQGKGYNIDSIKYRESALQKDIKPIDKPSKSKDDDNHSTPA